MGQKMHTVVDQLPISLGGPTGIPCCYPPFVGLLVFYEHSLLTDLQPLHEIGIEEMQTEVVLQATLERAVPLGTT